MKCYARIIQTIRFYFYVLLSGTRTYPRAFCGHNGDAKFNWDGEGFVMEYVHNIKTNDLKRIERMIAENTDIIINRWYELFKADNEDNQ